MDHQSLLEEFLIGILENYQQSDGSIKIPKVLKKYLNNKEFIKVND